MDCFKILSKHGDIDAEANQILKCELGENWDEKTYEEIRLKSRQCGFSSKYLFLSAKFTEFSSCAKTSTLLKLAKVDLQKGTKIHEIVFCCCNWFPKREAIEGLLEHGKTIEKKVIESVFEFQNHEGLNCLIVLFDLATKYRNKNKQKYPSGPMLVEIEKSCSYLIDLAKSADLDLDTILNHTTKSGDTLFLQASVFSEKITQKLLMEGVRVNSIDYYFVTPFFRVRSETDFR